MILIIWNKIDLSLIYQGLINSKTSLQSIQCGIMWVNCSQPCFCQAPWGGTKRSGFGRELGEWWVLEIFISCSKQLYKCYLLVCNLLLLFAGDSITTWAWSRWPSMYQTSHGDGMPLLPSCEHDFNTWKGDGNELKSQMSSTVMVLASICSEQK